MGQGPLDHPNYLTRQQIRLPNVTAGASGTSVGSVFNSQMRLRNATAVTVTAGTVGTSVAAIIQANGTGILQITSTAVTTSTGVVALGTCVYGTAGNTQYITSTSGDMNTVLPAGTIITVKNGADATAVCGVTLEVNLDPQATWTGNG